MKNSAMLSCDDVLDSLWELLDGELTRDMENAVQRHLERCERCYPQYDFQRAYAEMLRRVAQRMDPPHLRSRVLKRLLAEQVDLAT